MWSRIRSVGNTRVGTGVGPSFVDLVVLKGNLRPSSYLHRILDATEREPRETGRLDAVEDSLLTVRGGKRRPDSSQDAAVHPRHGSPPRPPPPLQCPPRPRRPAPPGPQ